ncbi:MAG: hypothetical protein DRQ46_08400 [Gammaproteobacteria bacterium]|nr:MAG: hypothetical protein DRQ46_08400 [Gammaproteobacteria bacterium]
MLSVELGELKEIVGLARSTVYRMSSKGKFPKPIKLGERSSGWIVYIERKKWRLRSESNKSFTIYRTMRRCCPIKETNIFDITRPTVKLKNCS